MFHVKHSDESGWLITLQFPSYIAVMTYADKRELRHEVYRAFATRASEGDFDNTQIMEEILVGWLTKLNLSDQFEFTEFGISFFK